MHTYCFVHMLWRAVLLKTESAYYSTLHDLKLNRASRWYLQAFLVHSTADKATVISVRLPGEQGAALVHSLDVKQHKTCMFYTLEQLLLLAATIKI